MPDRLMQTLRQNEPVIVLADIAESAVVLHGNAQDGIEGDAEAQVRLAGAGLDPNVDYEHVYPPYGGPYAIHHNPVPWPQQVNARLDAIEKMQTAATVDRKKIDDNLADLAGQMRVLAEQVQLLKQQEWD